jgi:hypothetical protein
VRRPEGTRKVEASALEFGRRAPIENMQAAEVELLHWFHSDATLAPSQCNAQSFRAHANEESSP